MSESMEIDQEVITRPNAIYVHGVDNLSTKDIKSYIKLYVDHDFKVEWINDSSLNIVFEEDSEAQDALNKLSNNEFTNIEEERPIKEMEGQKDLTLTARISNTGDKKVKNAAQYSRYYLLNPQEEKRYRKNDNYRDREQVRRRRRRSEEDVELFPKKASEFSLEKDEDLITKDENTEDDGDEDLFSRIGSRGSLSSRIGLQSQVNDEKDLSERLDNFDEPVKSGVEGKKEANGDLFSRIG